MKNGIQNSIFTGYRTFAMQSIDSLSAVPCTLLHKYFQLTASSLRTFVGMEKPDLSLSLKTVDSHCKTGSIRSNLKEWIWINFLVFSFYLTSPLAQLAARSSSPSFKGPSLPLTKKPSPGTTGLPPFSFRFFAILSAA